MNVKITPGKANGKISAPPSKSMAHRLLIAASMANGKSFISGVSQCDDVCATVECLDALGVKFEKENDNYTVCGLDFRYCRPSKSLFCRESGSTLRMLIPAATLNGNEVLFEAKESLLHRPITVFSNLYESCGFKFEKVDTGYRIQGCLPAGEYTLPGNISSQFISGMIFALAAHDEESVIHIMPPIESRSYIDMTLDVIKLFSKGAYFENNFTVRILGGGYSPANCEVEGDYSGAAFPAALNYLGGSVEIVGLNDSSKQGDRIYNEHYKMLKAGAPEIDISNCPDLAPILFTMASLLNGATFTGTARLKIKESDRATAMAEELEKIGGRLEIHENSVIVKKAALKTPSSVILSHNDHRIVMAMAIALTTVGGEISGIEAINKSYPQFFDDLRKLNINLEFYD